MRNSEVNYEPGKPAPKIEVGNGPYALVGFDLEFQNGDHKLHEIGLRYTAPYLVPKLADKNTDDPWRAKVRWVKIAS